MKKGFFPKISARLLGSWIPPFGIVCGLCAYSVSWGLLLKAGTGNGPSLFEKLAYIHTLTIGFFTLTALSILFHVMPAFTNTPWKKEKAARKTLPLLAAGWIGTTAFFLGGFRMVWAWGILLVVTAIFLWGSLFFLSMGQAAGKKPPAGSPLKFFLLPASFLMGTALLGGIMGGELAAGKPAAWIQSTGIPVHMSMGLLGWLTVLLWIVSSRTQRPILGAQSRHPGRVSFAIWLMGAGVILIAGSKIAGNGLTLQAGFFFVAGAVLLYLADAVGILARSSPPHPVFRAWWATGIAGLFASAMAGLWLVLRGFPRDADIFVYLVLVGWIQPFLLGHLHQIGVRLLATLVRGPQDMTPPYQILSGRLSWMFWATYVMAALSGLAGVAFSDGRFLMLAGGIGILSFFLLAAHILHMIGKCRSLGEATGAAPALIRFRETSSAPSPNDQDNPL